MKIKITAKFSASRRIRFEDTKRIVTRNTPEKFRDFRETGPWSRHRVRPSYGDFLNSFAMKAHAGPYGSYDNTVDHTEQKFHVQVPLSS